MQHGGWTIGSCASDEVEALVRELGLSEITASVLVRRGYGDPHAARTFLAGESPGHDPFLLGDMAEAIATIRAAIAAGKLICVHGDYDVDGICATALALHVLRGLGADAEWHLPSRFDEGYGLAATTLDRLAEGGCGLVITVDCGITAVEEVARAKSLGLEVVITDHHRPGEVLPDCPIVATRPSEYPFPELCGTGVVYKLAEALGAKDLDHHLDLVGLATIADVVPLVDENRALALAGLRALARTQKVGLQALMQVAGVDPAAVDEGSVGFRLAPRINAAGRLGHPRDALELLLTDDKEEAKRLAYVLEDVNRDRQAVEERILRAAIAQIESWPENRKRRHGYVVAGADWHEGVIGIVASRLVERYRRPVVLIAGTGADEGLPTGEEAAWKGSGRSVPAFDLHGALSACSDHLLRWGGHRAAAGLSIAPAEVEEFARAFAEHADAVLADDELAPVAHVDAVVSGDRLTLSLCEELKQLAPFGLGNPGVTLVLPSAEVGDLATVGDGKHLRFRVRDGARGGGTAIAFGQGGQLDRLRALGRWDVVFRLQENRWNGTVSPQLVVRRVLDGIEGYEELRARFAAEFRAGQGAWTADGREIFTELGLDGPRPVRRSLLESQRFRALLADPLAVPLSEAA
jgi:single-stranded-DNA-specific exonuclease